MTFSPSLGSFTVEPRTVQVFTTSRGPVRRVRLQLSEEDYEAAVDAHKVGALVRVTGQLTKPTKYRTINSPETFDALDADDAGEQLADEEGLFTFDPSPESDQEAEANGALKRTRPGARISRP
ncbi:MAG: hypothetical protein QM628_04990 [Propionicimonas sp.]